MQIARSEHKSSRLRARAEWKELFAQGEFSVSLSVSPRSLRNCGRALGAGGRGQHRGAPQLTLPGNRARMRKVRIRAPHSSFTNGTFSIPHLERNVSNRIVST
eukprot:4658313-Prymnesium_polylepis.3